MQHGLKYYQQIDICCLASALWAVYYKYAYFIIVLKRGWFLSLICVLEYSVIDPELSDGKNDMDYSRVAIFRKTIRERPVWGTFSKTEDPAMIEAMALAGMDFIILDTEHGPNTSLSLQNLIRAAEVGGMLPFIRIPEGDFTRISAALDIGAAGVQVPQVVTAADAQRAVEHARFYPKGNRGVCRYVRAAGYSSIDKSEYFRKADESILILQLEGKEALANFDAIVATEGLDILFVGPYDLSQSLGVPGQVDHPMVVSQVEEICRNCRKRGVTVGTFVESVQTARFWIERGVNYVCYSVDVGLMYQTCAGICRDFRAATVQLDLQKV